MSQVIEIVDLYKSFGKVKVLEGIHFSLDKGEVKALLGVNGAGKSTLIKIIGGVYQPTKGDFHLNGQLVKIKNEYDAKTKGISIIYQELSLIPTLTVIDNIFIGRETCKGIFLEKNKMKEAYQKLCEELEFYIDGQAIVGKLSIAQQQMVEIMKAVSCDSDIIIMDEPTTSLTNKEKTSLFLIIDKLKKLGKSILYISHILEEVLEICDTASIMRNGKIVTTEKIENLDKNKITDLMIGKEGNIILDKKNYCYADYKSVPVLELNNVCQGDEILDISFKVHKGEIVGIAGLVGSKRTELINIVYGITRKTSGKMLINGKEVVISSPEQAIKHKIGLIPEDRKNLGLILDHEIYKNATAIQIDKMKTNNFLDKRKESKFTDAGVEQLGIKINHINQKIKELSGGNQQKVVVLKWVGQDLDLIIYDEPTKGIDVSAKEDIFNTIEEFAKIGIGVLFISSDLNEVTRISDKIIVLKDGKLVSEMENDNIKEKDIMNKIFNI